MSKKQLTLKEVFMTEAPASPFKEGMAAFRSYAREELTGWDNRYVGVFQPRMLENYIESMTSSIKEEMSAAFEREVRSVTKGTAREDRERLKRRSDQLRKSLKMTLDEVFS